MMSDEEKEVANPRLGGSKLSNFSRNADRGVSMFKCKVFLVVGMSLLLAGVSGAASEEQYAQTIENFKRVETVKPFFGNAYGYAVFPTIGKGGMGIGAAHGQGQVYRGGKATGITSVTDISFGFQLGGSQTEAEYHKGLLVFVMGKGGLMYEASIGGQKYGFKPLK